MINCPRCNREAMGWHLRRRDVCSPQGWAFCLREPDVILATRHEPAMPLTQLRRGQYHHNVTVEETKS